MKNNRFLILIAMCLLLTSIFAVVPAFSVQPPVDTSTYYIGTIGQPRSVDPARSYDTASGELIFNVYETLIFFADKPLAPIPGANRSTEITSAYIADLAAFEPMLASAMPTISADGKTWTFTIRPNVKFQDWKKADGTVVSGQILTADDVEYSFKKGMVQDLSGSPQWMINLPGVGRMSYGGLDKDTTVPGIQPVGVDGQGERLAASLIDNFITVSGNEVTFHFFSAWPEGPLMQIFAQSWGSIVNKAFSIEHGCWDGEFTDGWSALYRRMPASGYGPVDRFYAAKSKFTTDTTPVMCGTGPYKFTSWDKANKVWRIDKFDNYWKGWAGSHLTTVISKGIDAWPTRKMLFLEGEFDVLAVPRANMYDLLEPGQQFGPIQGIHLYYNQPALSLDCLHYVLSVVDGSPYMPKVTGMYVPTFFGDMHVRQAFNHALNFTSYLADAWFNEGIQPSTWWVEGLAPNYKDYTLTPPDIDTARIEAELKQAFVPAISNTSSLWDLGFETYLIYNLGNDQRKIACDMIQQTFLTLGAKYKVNVIGLDWPVVLEGFEEFRFPTFIIGWLADFADADNFARPYMHSEGDFSYFQGYSNPHVDELIDEGILTPDGPAREAIYKELQAIFLEDAISLPLVQAVGRRWVRDWERGYYYNQLYPGGYYYDRYKQTGALESIDLDVSHSITPTSALYPVVYFYRYGMKIGNGDPNPALMTYSITVQRTDSNTNIGLLYTSVGLKRQNTTGPLPPRDATTVPPTAALPVEYPNGTYVILPPGGSATVSLNWYEEGVTQKIVQAVWQLGAETFPVTSNANDTNRANNYIADGTVDVKGPLTGDINQIRVGGVVVTTGDGAVDVLDAITLALSYGKKAGETGYNADANLKKGDATPEEINILDAIVLATSFGKHIP